MFKGFRIQSLFLGSAFTIVTILGCLVGTIYWESHAIDTSTKEVSRAENTNKETLRAKYYIVQIQQFLTDASLTGEMDSIKEAKENAEALDKSLSTITELSPNLKEHADGVRQGAQLLSTMGLEMVAAYLDHGKAAGDAIMKRKDTGFDAASEALGQKMDALTKEVEAKSEASSKFLENSHANMKFYAVSMALLASFCASFGLFVLYRRIRPLEHIVRALEQQTHSVRHASEELNQTATSLSSATANQSSAAQETAASLEEINAMGQQTSDNSHRMRQNAESSGRSVDEGKSTVVEMLSAVDEIRRNNQRVGADVDQGNQQVAEIVKVISEIGDKTKVINDIVFQTKLLSFNASVEAARAGEHGKGFAVVAEEVGNLANMSGNAAREISDMLDGGVARVQKILEDNRSRLQRSMNEANEKTEDGSKTAERCGHAFESIVGNVGEVTQAVQEISSAIEEQRKGLDEIGRALLALEKSTQDNALAATTTTETAQGLLSESEKLNGLIVELRSILTGSNANTSQSYTKKHSVVAFTPRRTEPSTKTKVRKAA